MWGGKSPSGRAIPLFLPPDLRGRALSLRKGFQGDAMSPQATIQSIYRYPVKGFSPESLPATELAVGQTLPADRRYAVENGPTGFDPASPAYFPKIRFLMLMKNERLAQLRTRYDDATDVLTVHHDGREVARGNLSTAAGRKAIEDFMAVFCADELRGPPKVLE